MVPNQQYEKYWKITLEYTNIDDARFIGTLGIIKDFIDENNGTYNRELYKDLQTRVNKKFPKKDMASVRKSINQFVKLGFIEPFLKGYNDWVVDFLNAKTSIRRKSLFSKTVYEYSSFNSAVTTSSRGGHIAFLIDTLEEVGELEPADIGALMTLDISKYESKYLTKNKLDEIKQKMNDDEFLARKYNQLSHFRSILNRLSDVTFKNNTLYFTEDAEKMFPDSMKKTGRDAYMQRVFKTDLKEESQHKTGMVACMVERIAYPILIASHIKPLSKCNKSEEFVPSNGLLLTRSMDALFDHGNISFENDGKIILCDTLHSSTRDYLKKMEIHNAFLSSDRSRYLSYHRKNVFKQ